MKSLLENTQLQEQEIFISDPESILIDKDATLVDALSRMGKNGFETIFLVDENNILEGKVTDRIIKSAIIKKRNLNISLSSICKKEFPVLYKDDNTQKTGLIFQNSSINYLPVLSREKEVLSVITRSQYQWLLLEDLPFDLTAVNSWLDDRQQEHPICHRPWGFYKSLLISDFVQTKLISVNLAGQLSLQKHLHRKKYWVVVKGRGIATIGNEKIEVFPGKQLFIDKQAVHRIENKNRDESLVFIEVQLGSYFGEDDIIRLEDKYGRV